jgi:hypothetical protein
MSALTPGNVDLIWEDIDYQVAVGFIRLVKARDLFGPNQTPNLKISRVAVVPHADRQGRIILNLSAEVDNTRQKPSRQHCHKDRRPGNCTVLHPSVNETTVPARDQSGVEELGRSLPSILKYMFDTNCTWEIDLQKLDLLDGFWRMVIESGEEYNFAFQMPKRKGDPDITYIIPSSLQMGWKNSPAYFCVATQTTRELIKQMLAFMHTRIKEPHKHEKHCIPNPSPSPAPP